MSRVVNELSQSYLKALLSGDRSASREVIESAMRGGNSARDLLTKLVWPTMELLQELYRDDRITISY